MDNENALISRAQSGDEGAFTELMRANYAFVYAIVIGIVNNPNDAEEVVQDTFLNAYRGLPQLEDTKRFKGWLTRIARNRALNWLREQRIDTVSIDEVSEYTLQISESLDEGLIRDEQRELIRRAMESLSKKDRDIAGSYYLDGASYDELIRTHGLSYKAISFRLSRAKQKLAKRLGHLLTGVFVSPASTLKQIYSGGFTVMKVGTVPKITAGAVAIIVLAFIGTRQFTSSKEDSSPSVEVVTSTPNESANSVTQRNPTRTGAVTAPLREDKPQISAEEMEQIEDFFAQLDESDAESEANSSQLSTDAASDRDAETGNTGPSVASESTILSAEEVMNAFIEAYRNADFEAIRPLLTGTIKEQFEGNGSARTALGKEVVVHEEIIIHDGASTAEEVQEMIMEGIAQRIEQMSESVPKVLNQTEVVSSGYFGDEFHFQLQVPKLEWPEVPGLVGSPDTIQVPPVTFKLRKEGGTWLIYGME